MRAVKLKDIASIYNGNSINKKIKQEKYMLDVPGYNYIATKDVNFDGTVTYRNGVVIPYNEPKFKTAPAGAVLVCSEGGSAGKKTAYITEEVCFGNKLYAFVNSKNLFIGKYLYYYTQTIDFFNQFKSLMNGIIGGVTIKNIGEIIIPLPSLEEQELIVAKIEELFSNLDNAVKTLNEIKQKLEIYKHSILEDAFKALINERYLADLATMIDPQPSHRTPPKVDKGVPYIGIGDINYADGKIDFVNSRHVDNLVLTEHLNRYTLRAGDFIMGKIGTIGKPFQLPLPQKYALSANVILIQPNSKLINPQFLFWQFSSNQVTKQLLAEANATSQPAFGIKKSRLLRIKICDMKTQEKIVRNIEEKISTYNKILDVVNTTLLQTSALRQSILKQAFEGRLI